MKKVLIFSLAYYPHVGGAEVSVKEITDRLSDIEFHMVTLRFLPEEKAEEKIGNVYVHRILSSNSRLNKLLFQFFAYKKAAALHAKHQFSAIWALMAHSSGVPAGLFKSKFPKVGYVLNLQEGDPLDHIEKTMLPLWPLFKRGFTTADIVQSLSIYLESWARRMGYHGHVEIIPNAVNFKHFSHEFLDIEIKNERESLFHAKDDDFILVTTSRLVKKNAIDDVIRALPLLPENVRFAVGGVGPDEAGLRALARELHVETRLQWLGQVDHRDMPRMLKACDAFIRPSRSEGFGASFPEAMAAGLPVIATQEGGIADFLFDEKRNPDKPTTGWAVDKDSPEQIAEAVKDILARPEKVKEVTERAKKMVQEKYDWDIIARDMREKVFTRLFA